MKVPSFSLSSTFTVLLSALQTKLTDWGGTEVKACLGNNHKKYLNHSSNCTMQRSIFENYQAYLVSVCLSAPAIFNRPGVMTKNGPLQAKISIEGYQKVMNTKKSRRGGPVNNRPSTN